METKNVGGEGKIGEWARYSYTYMFRMGVDITKALKRLSMREGTGNARLSLRECVPWLEAPLVEKGCIL